MTDMSTTDRFTIKRIREASVPLWCVMPNRRWLDGSHQAPIAGLGRRDAVAPIGSALAATWKEAMDYATAGTMPRPIVEVYPEWCGVRA